MTRARAVAAACGVLPVGALLAWCFDLGTFRSWFLVVGLPPLALLVGLSVVVVRRGDRGYGLALASGVIGGLAGTIGYDLFRVPFALNGLRVFAPIESYGVLIVGADSSSPLTDLAGWSFHFVNGLGFGIAYAMVALGRNRWWAVGWAMVLETATVLTPFAGTYGLAGQWHLIGIAYAAHVAYGLPLGSVVRSAPHARRAPLTPALAGGTVVALVAVMLLWHQPWSTPASERTGRALAPGPSAVVVGGELRPEWLRVAPGGCAAIGNDDERSYVLTGSAGGERTLEPGIVARVCFDDPGVHRLKLDGRAYSGGFVIVDRRA